MSTTEQTIVMSYEGWTKFLNFFECKPGDPGYEMEAYRTLKMFGAAEEGRMDWWGFGMGYKVGYMGCQGHSDQ